MYHLIHFTVFDKECISSDIIFYSNIPVAFKKVENVPISFELPKWLSYLHFQTMKIREEIKLN